MKDALFSFFLLSIFLKNVYIWDLGYHANLALHTLIHNLSLTHNIADVSVFIILFFKMAIKLPPSVLQLSSVHPAHTI